MNMLPFMGDYLQQKEQQKIIKFITKMPSTDTQ